MARTARTARPERSTRPATAAAPSPATKFPARPAAPSCAAILAARISAAFVGDPLPSYPTDADSGGPPDPDLAHTERLRELCRRGNPFPLIAWQWPEFVVTDPAEQAYFLPAGIKPTDGPPDPLNPILRFDSWQRDILASFFDETIKEIFIKGCVGAGKGTASSLCFNLAFDVWNDCRIILTSATFEHAVDTIFAEVSKWRNKMAHPGPGKLLAEGIYHTKQHRMMVLNPLTGEAFSGKHGEKIIYGFDEASQSRQLLYDNALNQFHKLVALSNPRTLFGWYRDGFKPCSDPDVTQTVSGPFGLRRCVTVSGLDCMNVRERRLESPIAPFGGIEIAGRQFAHNERIPPELMAHVRPLIPHQSDYGRYMGILQHPDKREVEVKAHGKFPTEDASKQVILASWLDRHEAAFSLAAPPAVECFGFDAARSLDGDSSVFAAGGIAGLRRLHRWQYADTNQHVANILRIASQEYGIDLTAGQHPIAVDCDGYGSGVADILRGRGCWILEFRGNSSSLVDPRRYANLRAEGYGTLGRRLDPNDQWGNQAWALATDDQDALQWLRLGLTAPEKVYGADALRFHITPKNRQPGMSESILTVKEKLGGRSPDEADATVYLFYAVRELHRLNEWFASYAAPLIAYPAATNGIENNGHSGNGHAENGQPIAPNMAASPTAPNGQPQIAPTPAGPSVSFDGLLSWLNQQYAGTPGTTVIREIRAGGSVASVSVVDDGPGETDDDH